LTLAYYARNIPAIPINIDPEQHSKSRNLFKSYRVCSNPKLSPKKAILLPETLKKSANYFGTFLNGNISPQKHPFFSPRDLTSNSKNLISFRISKETRAKINSSLPQQERKDLTRSKIIGLRKGSKEEIKKRENPKNKKRMNISGLQKMSKLSFTKAKLLIPQTQRPPISKLLQKNSEDTTNDGSTFIDLKTSIKCIENIKEEVLVKENLGSGSFSRVYSGFDRVLQKQVAIKIVQLDVLLDSRKLAMFEDEVRIATKISHPNLMKGYRVIKDKKRLYFITEYCGKATLKRIITDKKNGRMLESEARSIFVKLVDAVKHLHRRNICHRDIKLSNILVDKIDEVRIIDFGFATSSKLPLTLYCGTPCYMAPELIKREKYSGKSVDVWALGVLLFKIITGDYPFGGTLLI